MPKTIHTATAPNGQTFKRTSQNRVYSHLALGRRSKEEALRRANAKEAQVSDGRNWDFHLEQAEGRWTCSSYQRDPEWAAPRIKRDIAEGTAWIAQHPDRAAYIAQQHAERLANVEDTNFDLWHDLGWASRLDLAQKNAATHKNRSAYWAETLIIEAVVA